MTRDASESEAVSILKDDVGTKQIQDPFEDTYTIDPLSVSSAIRPPYRMETLKMLPIRNAILLQCIHAMVTNCHSFGHSLVFIGEKGQETSTEAEAEKTRIENLLDYPNDFDSFSNIRMKIGTDYEVLGNGYIEVGRNLKGNVSFFYHVAGENVRLCKIDQNPVKMQMTVMREGKSTLITARRYFRRFVQLIGSKKVYFKEFGDPRKVDPQTGNVNESLALEDQATELMHIPQYWSGSPYGIPCWVNNMPAILGMREAEMVNLQYFEDNAIPAMAIIVAGGSLSEETLLDIQAKFVNSKGRDQVNRVVVIEAVADMDAAGNTDSAPPVPNVTLQPLRDAQQSDALFLAYDEASMMKIRGSFRLPPIYVGRSDDYTRATAESSAQLAEVQVFTPRRNTFDDLMNKGILMFNQEPPKYWRLKSNGSRLVDPALILQALTVLEALGAASPNLAIQIANDLFGLDLSPIEDDWGNKPFEFVKQELQRKMMEAKAPKAPGEEEDNTFPIKKTDMEALTRVTMALGKWIDERGEVDEELRKTIAEKKVAKAEKARLEALERRPLLPPATKVSVQQTIVKKVPAAPAGKTNLRG